MVSFKERPKTALLFLARYLYRSSRDAFAYRRSG
jgi:hypothetical protein